MKTKAIILLSVLVLGCSLFLYGYPKWGSIIFWATIPYQIWLCFDKIETTLLDSFNPKEQRVMNAIQARRDDVSKEFRYSLELTLPDYRSGSAADGLPFAQDALGKDILGLPEEDQKLVINENGVIEESPWKVTWKYYWRSDIVSIRKSNREGKPITNSFLF